MAKQYETAHAIGDLVYTASERGIDRDVIKAIKITSLEENIKYGIERAAGIGIYNFLGHPDGYEWFALSDVSIDKESAQARHENLKAKADADRVKRREQERMERKAELEQELRDLESRTGIYKDDES